MANWITDTILQGLTAKGLAQSREKSLREKMGHLNEVYGFETDDEGANDGEMDIAEQEVKDYDECDRL